MKSKVLIITHGVFGIELKRGSEMIMGERDDVQALGLLPDQSVDDLREQAYAIVEANEAEGTHTIIMCDLMGGSPSNVALACLAKADCDVVLGVNMPMLIETIQQIDFEDDPAKLVAAALEAAKTGIIHKSRANLKG